MAGNRNFGNRTLFHGDNIVFLRAMNSETVDLIVTDPPFAKWRNFHATPDSLATGASFQDRWMRDDAEARAGSGAAEGRRSARDTGLGDAL